MRFSRLRAYQTVFIQSVISKPPELLSPLPQFQQPWLPCLSEGSRDEDSSTQHEKSGEFPLPLFTTKVAFICIVCIPTWGVINSLISGNIYFPRDLIGF